MSTGNKRQEIVEKIQSQITNQEKYWAGDELEEDQLNEEMDNLISNIEELEEEDLFFEKPQGFDFERFSFFGNEVYLKINEVDGEYELKVENRTYKISSKRQNGEEWKHEVWTMVHGRKIGETIVSIQSRLEENDYELFSWTKEQAERENERDIRGFLDNLREQADELLGDRLTEEEFNDHDYDLMNKVTSGYATLPGKTLLELPILEEVKEFEKGDYVDIDVYFNDEKDEIRITFISNKTSNQEDHFEIIEFGDYENLFDLISEGIEHAREAGEEYE